MKYNFKSRPTGKSFSEMIQLQLYMENESKKQTENIDNSNEKLLLSDVSVAVEKILQPKYMNDVYTWKQVKDAILKATER